MIDPDVIIPVKSARELPDNLSSPRMYMLSPYSAVLEYTLVLVSVALPLM